MCEWRGFFFHTITLQVLRVSSFVHAPCARLQDPLSITFISRISLMEFRELSVKRRWLYFIFLSFFSLLPFSLRAFELYSLQKTPAPTPSGLFSSGITFISDGFCWGFCGILSENPSVRLFVIDVPRWEPLSRSLCTNGCAGNGKCCAININRQSAPEILRGFCFFN